MSTALPKRKNRSTLLFQSFEASQGVIPSGGPRSMFTFSYLPLYATGRDLRLANQLPKLRRGMLELVGDHPDLAALLIKDIDRRLAFFADPHTNYYVFFGIE